jgi:DNA-binding PadR family transcriptional regulator
MESTEMTEQSRGFRWAFPILKFLILNPVNKKNESGQTPFSIEREVHVDRPTVYEAIEMLTKARLVKVAKEKSHVKGKIRTYDANEAGLIAVLQAHSRDIVLNPREPEKKWKRFKVTRDDVRAFAQDERLRRFLPQILGKWQYFKEKEAEDLAVEELLDAANRLAEIYDGVEKLLEVSKGRDYSMFDFLEADPRVLRYGIYEEIFDACLFSIGRRTPLGDAMRADAEIVREAERLIRCRLKDAVGEVSSLENRLGFLRGEKGGTTKGDPRVFELSEHSSDFVGRYAGVVSRTERAIGLDSGADPATLPAEREIADEFINNMFGSFALKDALTLPETDPRGKSAREWLETARVDPDERKICLKAARSLVNRYRSTPDSWGQFLRNQGVKGVEKFIQDVESLVRQLEEIDGSSDPD